jgi:hypothetical protein
MNYNKYKNIPKKVKLNRHKTSLLLLPLVNEMYEYCRPYNDIKIKLDSRFYNNLSPNQLNLQIIYNKEIISIASTESIHYEDMIYNVIYYIKNNKIDIIEELDIHVEDINEIFELIKNNFIKKILDKDLMRSIDEFGYRPNRIRQTGKSNTINKFAKNNNII